MHSIIQDPTPYCSLNIGECSCNLSSTSTSTLTKKISNIRCPSYMDVLPPVFFCFFFKSLHFFDHYKTFSIEKRSRCNSNFGIKFVNLKILNFVFILPNKSFLFGISKTSGRSEFIVHTLHINLLCKMKKKDGSNKASHIRL